MMQGQAMQGQVMQGHSYQTPPQSPSNWDD